MDSTEPKKKYPAQTVSADSIQSKQFLQGFLKIQMKFHYCTCEVQVCGL